MPRHQQYTGTALVAGMVFGLATVGWPTGAGAEAPPPEGPPLSQVLAADPSEVEPPSTDAADVTAAAASCPPAPYGVRSAAPGTGKTVALTFDDGPGVSTAAIMAILEDEGVAATFFNVGVNSTVRPGLVQDEAAQGFLLGNHTWDHADLTTLTAAQQAAEMDRATAEQVARVGSPPCYFRPPYGAYNTTTLNLAQARNMAVWNWSVDTEDWRSQGSSSAEWVLRIIQRAQAGGSQTHPTVLLHNPPNGLPATVAALPAIIQFYRDRGYTFVDLAGQVAAKPIPGDWDGNGTMTPGVARGAGRYLRNANSSGGTNVAFAFGLPTDRAVAGDWDGNGTMTPGIVRAGGWYLRNANNGGAADMTFAFGQASDRPVVGDWDGNGTMTPGIVRAGGWYLRNANSGGAANVTFGYGRSTDRPVVGDWDGNGTMTVGIVRGNIWHLRNSNSGGAANVTFGYGRSTDRPVVGDWDGNGTMTPGVVRGNTWLLRNSNTPGGADITVTFTP